ncbi:hypothetical protein H6S82_17100 [Planktothrix sp. FACHB-1355]|uniref:Uncharacterized protein n=1 Tax=Aerosakkonema funiforme FACHB-1375 TaxID=2949571 RepID=A0A926ZI72_9CYAN|nr:MULTISPECIES: hypothetical protein [Oscillatoriales]MBD2181506.1 hypothetical protein [Aerosakkonema funiforme FACHB-1375]MBD3560555.1 hypothetical protein [Planktothrix sp. FACHB-1355]
MVQKNTLKERIEKIIGACPNAENDYLEATDWLYDIDADKIDKIIADFEIKYENVLKECIQIIGDPTYNEKTNRSLIDEWYPEAIRISCWEMSDRLFYLSLEQHDTETPVSILIACKIP